MKIYLITITLFLVGHSAIDDWKTLENEHYSIKYPDNWVPDQSGQSGTRFILYGPAVQGQLFRNNINLIIQDLSGQNVDLAKFVEISTGQIKEFIASSNILYSQTESLRHKIVYTGMHGDFSLQWAQYYWVKNNQAYVLTFTADRKSYDDTINLATQVMDGFKIK